MQGPGCRRIAFMLSQWLEEEGAAFRCIFYFKISPGVGKRHGKETPLEGNRCQIAFSILQGLNWTDMVRICVDSGCLRREIDVVSD